MTYREEIRFLILTYM